jgi:small subunit ribosomal protein S4e
MLYDTRGRFAILPITAEEAKYKLCKVKSRWIGAKGVPYINTHDGRTIRYPDPAISANDSIKLDLEADKIVDHVKFEVGNMCMITGGNNLGRVGVITNKEKHPGSIDIVHVKDAAGHSFATRVVNIFLIGKGTQSLVSLPKAKGVKRSIIEKLEARTKRAAARAAPSATAAVATTTTTA